MWAKVVENSFIVNVYLILFMLISALFMLHHCIIESQHHIKHCGLLP